MIYKIFSNNLHLTPDAIAIVTSDGKSYTYAEANRRINQWANYLIEQGIESGDRVGVLLDNEDDHVFIFLALDRINATYVPFDTDIPKRQLTIDIARLQLKKFIIEESICDNFAVDSEIQLTLSPAELARVDAQKVIEPSRIYDTNGFEKIAYIVSSSGSTGGKKWIPILGAGLVYWAETEKKLFEPSPITKVLSTRSPGYDARISEYVRAFGSGAELHLLTRIQRKDFTSILAVCKRESISCLLLIASQLRSEHTERIIAELEDYGVKHLMVTGDACTLNLKRLGETYDLSIWNCYGPTEATFGLSILRINGLHPVNADIILEPIWLVPIGKPYGDAVRYHLIDQRLYIESPYLTPGYLDPLDNEAAFKWVTNDAGEAIRLFDTGDEFYEEDKYLIYQGRASLDSHCKIDGVKVSPFLIEQCIQDYNVESTSQSMQTAVVIKDHLGKYKPFAYLVIHSPLVKTLFLTYLKERLKKEEFPILIQLDELPKLYPSQKIDRQQLIHREDNLEEYFFREDDKISTETSDQTDEKLQLVKEIWSQLFHRKNIPLDVEFIFLGGDSLMALEMVSQINKQIDPEYSYTHLLNLKKITINAVANSLVEKKGLACQDTFIHQLVFRGEEKKNIFFLPALLGEGYFSYRFLAARMAEQFDCNIYGLSDPGISHKGLLPVSMKHAVQRHIRAMKTIQLHGGYQILGFSFGATLAEELVRELNESCESVKELHLVDGFPPYLYHMLSDEAHVELLESLINFIVSTLTNPFYKETLEPLNLRRDFDAIETLSKQQQIDVTFDYLEKKLKNPTSINMLNMAKCNLGFILKAKMPQQKSPVWPTFYLTNKQQHYLQIINSCTGLSKNSSDYHYYYWTRYFRNITRCGIELIGEHLTVLDPGPAVHKQTPDCFFSRGTDSEFNMARVDEYGPRSFYFVRPVSPLPDSDYQLSIFFLACRNAYRLAQRLTDAGFSPRVVLHDQNLLKSLDGEDTIYSSAANVFCLVPHEQYAQIKLITRGIPANSCIGLPRRSALGTISSSNKQSGSIELLLLYKEARSTHQRFIAQGSNETGNIVTIPLLSLSFKYHTIPDLVIESLQQQLGVIPTHVTQGQENIIYEQIILAGGSIYDLFFRAEKFLADFISLLLEHVPEASAPLPYKSRLWPWPNMLNTV